MRSSHVFIADLPNAGIAERIGVSAVKREAGTIYHVIKALSTRQKAEGDGKVLIVTHWKFALGRKNDFGFRHSRPPLFDFMVQHGGAGVGGK